MKRDNYGYARVDFYVHVPDEIKMHPQSDIIQVEFSSSEIKFPSGYPQTTVVSATRVDNTNSGLIIRLNELFGLNPWHRGCKFFTGTVIISDHIPAYMNLYVSSSDHLIYPRANRRDYAITVGSSSEGEIVTSESSAKRFNFGTFRGLGYDSQDSGQYVKKWYSYDEFITSGGIEIIKADSIIGGYGFTGEKPKAAVQSEADVLLVFAHGLSTLSDHLSLLANFSFPDYTNQMNNYPSWSYNAKYHFAYPLGDPNYLISTGGKIYNDYGTDYWGNFWLAKSREPGFGEPDLRWLTIVGCTALSRGGDEGPAENWREVIDTGYLSSVCGFQGNAEEEIGPFDWAYPDNYVQNGNFTAPYGDQMEFLFNKYDTYEPDEFCYREIAFWEKPTEISSDISVSAYMETACRLAGRYKNLSYKQFNLDMAVAIDQDNVDDNYYYYELKEIDEKDIYEVGPWYKKKVKYDMKISRSGI